MTNFWWHEDGCRSSSRFIHTVYNVGPITVSFVFITAAELTFLTCGDDIHSVYAEGVLLGLNTWPTCCQNTNVTIPANATVVGVQVNNTDAYGGWKGIFSDGSGTNASSWKCTESPQTDTTWSTAGYDDSSWKVPKTITNSTTCHRFPTPNWLWTSSDNTAKITVYCRTVLRM